MYTLEQLQQKTLKELKEIGSEFNVVPSGDRRCRQNWIDALVGVNLPLLKLLETSPGVEVDRVSEAIAQVVETSPGVEVDRVSEAIAQVVETSLGVEVDRVSEAIAQVVEISPGVEVDRVQEPIAQVVETSPGVEVDRVSEAIAQVVEISLGVEVDRVSEAIAQVVEISPGVEVDQIQRAIEVQVQKPIESKFGRIVYPKAAAEPMAPAAKNLTPGGINETKPNTDRTESADLHHRCLHSTQPDGNNSGIETKALASQKGDRVLAVSGDSQADRRRLLPNQSNELTATIFTDEQPSNRGDGRGRVESEVKVNQSAIAPDVKISVGVEADRSQKSKSSIAHQLLDLFKSSVACSQDSIELAAKTPPGVETDYLLEPIEIPTSVTFSSRFLSLYSPPQSENIFYKADANGQLSLLDFEVPTELEPPDPDDFESLDDFRQAIALWDIEHPESLEVSLDSFTCQADYELAESSEVMEFSSAILAEGCVNESSSTYNFSTPTFDAWCDRTNRNSSDEPLTAGVRARRPKPKPPSFPPMVVAAGDRTNGNFLDELPTAGVGARRFKPKPPSFPLMVVAAGDRSSIKKFVRSAIILSARAPPGGDVVN